jgi:hypothetical protein
MTEDVVILCPPPYDALFDGDWTTVQRARSPRRIATRDLVHLETLFRLVPPEEASCNAQTIPAAIC